MPSEPTPGHLPQQGDAQSEQYDYMAGGSQDMWAGAGQTQSNECWQASVDQTHFASQCAHMEQAPQLQRQMPLPVQDQCQQLIEMTDHLLMAPQAQQHQMQQQMPFQARPQMIAQQPQVQQMTPTAMDEQTIHMFQMQSQQMHLPQLPHMDLPQTPMSYMSGEQTPMSHISGASTPSDIDRCMAIVMPTASQLVCDRDLMALQLKAAAELQQCYED